MGLGSEMALNLLSFPDGKPAMAAGFSVLHNGLLMLPKMVRCKRNKTLHLVVQA
jgi:hypothetical protein